MKIEKERCVGISTLNYDITISKSSLTTSYYLIVRYKGDKKSQVKEFLDFDQMYNVLTKTYKEIEAKEGVSE